MTIISQHIKYLIQTIIILLIMTFLSTSFADPPKRVVRISHVFGDVTMTPQTDNNVLLNRILLPGDRLMMDASGRAELQLGGAAIRTWNNTNLAVLQNDDAASQFGLYQGSVNLNIWNMQQGIQYEIDTPNLAFIPTTEGDYRIDVNVDSNTTVITMKKGQAVVYGDQASFQLDENQRYTFTGTDLSNYVITEVLSNDAFDTWYALLNDSITNSKSAQYVPDTMIGYQDLDQNGNWVNETNYGNVWIPENVPDDWAPYRDGFWNYEDPWGWTWIDDQAWGFATSHYGRWAYGDSRWMWIPGRIDLEPVYAPALVIFLSGSDFQLALSLNGGFVNGIGWLPLGPGDVYIPPYDVSQGYFNVININNTYINNQFLTNAYQHPHEKRNYFNWKENKAFTAVPVTSFQKGEAVNKTRKPIPSNLIPKANINNQVNIKPVSARVVGKVTTPSVMQRSLIVKSPPAEKARQRLMDINYKRVNVLKPPVKLKSSPIQPSTLPATKPVLTPPTKEIKPLRKPELFNQPNVQRLQQIQQPSLQQIQQPQQNIQKQRVRDTQQLQQQQQNIQQQRVRDTQQLQQQQQNIQKQRVPETQQLEQQQQNIQKQRVRETQQLQQQQQNIQQQRVQQTQQLQQQQRVQQTKQPQQQQLNTQRVREIQQFQQSGGLEKLREEYDTSLPKQKGR